MKFQTYFYNKQVHSLCKLSLVFQTCFHSESISTTSGSNLTNSGIMYLIPVSKIKDCTTLCSRSSNTRVYAFFLPSEPSCCFISSGGLCQLIFIVTLVLTCTIMQLKDFPRERKLQLFVCPQEKSNITYMNCYFSGLQYEGRKSGCIRSSKIGSCL